jgi:hypothetical protein
LLLGNCPRRYALTFCGLQETGCASADPAHIERNFIDRAVAIFPEHVDDAASVHDIVRRIEDATPVKPSRVPVGLEELVVSCAQDNPSF